MKKRVENIDDFVYRAFKLVNSRRKCEFMIDFPVSGTNLTEIINDGHLGNINSVVWVLLNKYMGFFNKEENIPVGHEKKITLNIYGVALQTIARNMIQQNQRLNRELNTDTDCLGLFFEKSNPKNIIRVIEGIYVKGATTYKDVARSTYDSDTAKIIERLEEYGLITTHIEQRNSRKHIVIEKTMAGEQYYFSILAPCLDNLKRIYQNYRR